MNQQQAKFLNPPIPLTQAPYTNEMVGKLYRSIPASEKRLYQQEAKLDKIRWQQVSKLFRLSHFMRRASDQVD